MDLSSIRALITGGSSGIGLATATLLVRAGAQVVICGRDTQRLEQAAEKCGAKAVRADVSVESDVNHLVHASIEQLGDLNVVINNAAFGYFAPLVEQDTERFCKLFDTNVLGAMLVARAAAKHFIKKNTGNIINVASTAGLRGYAGGSAYAASKFALSGLTECWRAELRTYNIRVMQINPSEVITDFSRAAGRSQTGNERKLQAEDIAQAILSVLSMHDRGFVTDLTVWATNPS